MKPRTAIQISAATVAIYVVLVVAVYAVNIGSLPLSKTTAEPWGQFGDYIGGMLNPLFALLNVAVVLYIASSLHRRNEEEKAEASESAQRIQCTVDLHKEWNSESIYRSRNIANKLSMRHPRSTIFEIEKIEPAEEVAHFWVVVGFFQRLGFLLLHSKVHEEMTRELFAELFVWWWAASYNRQLKPCACDASDQLLILNAWFEENTTDEQREPWLQRARNDLSAAEERAGLFGP